MFHSAPPYVFGATLPVLAAFFIIIREAECIHYRKNTDYIVKSASFNNVITCSPPVGNNLKKNICLIFWLLLQRDTVIMKAAKRKEG